VEGANIANPEELVKLAVTAGLPAAEAGEVLRTRACRKAVDADWALSRQMGITAVPTFVLDDRGVVGAQPYEILERLLENGGVQRK
jgi:predicted DsbA family dithiol-disulfide isomerase